MAWDFETDREYQAQLDWANEFVRTKVEPLDLLFHDPSDKSDRSAVGVVTPLQEEVRERGLWACHLSPELGGQGYGQVKLALLNEILGRSKFAPTVFGCQAPDSGNAEILAHYGTLEQKERYLQPLLEGRMSSSYAMTEPSGGADPTLFTTHAIRDGDEWVINGEKFFASNARTAEFFIAIVKTRFNEDPYKSFSSFIIPADAPGLTLLRGFSVGTSQKEGGGSHGYLRFEDVRVPADHLLGSDGGAFIISQTRLSGGRIHHAMRTVGKVKQAFDMMCERALSRQTRSGVLASLQATQEKIADSWIEIEQFRLLVLRTAWLIDKHRDYLKVRKDIAAVKVVMPRVLHDVVQRSMHLHGAIGVSTEMPFAGMLIAAEALGIADGPTEVHQQTLAKSVLKTYRRNEGLWPSGHLPTRREAAMARVAGAIEVEVGNI